MSKRSTADLFTQFTHSDAQPQGNLIYTHGGAYVDPLSIFHWGIIQALVDITNTHVVVPAYPLAPEHTYQAAFDQLEVVYRNLLDTLSAPAHLFIGQLGWWRL